MAPKNATTKSSRKAVRSASQVSTTASAASGGVMTRSMTKAAGEQLIVAAPSQSHKIQNLGSKVSDGVNQIVSNVLKQKSVVGFIMPQTILCGMDELQTYTNLAF